MCSGSEADSYLRLIDFCITQLESNKEEEYDRRPDAPAVVGELNREGVSATINRLSATLSVGGPCVGARVVYESGPLRAVHLSRHKWPGGLVN